MHLRMDGRWLTGLFFTLFIFPFIVVWSATEGRQRLADHLPVYSVASVGRVEIAGADINIFDLTIKKLRDCRADGAVTALVPFRAEGRDHQVVAVVELDGTGHPVVLRDRHTVGEIWTIPHWRVRLTEDVAATAQSVTFDLPCALPVLGLVRTTLGPLPIRTTSLSR